MQKRRKLREYKRLCLYALFVCSTPFFLWVIIRSTKSAEHGMFFDVFNMNAWAERDNIHSFVFYSSNDLAINIFYAYLMTTSIVNVTLFLLTIWNIVHTNQELMTRREDIRFLDRFIAEKRRYSINCNKNIHIFLFNPRCCWFLSRWFFFSAQICVVFSHIHFNRHCYKLCCLFEVSLQQRHSVTWTGYISLIATRLIIRSTDFKAHNNGQNCIKVKNSLINY